MSGRGSADGSAWVGSVLGRYERRLVRYAARITGDVERARDVVQDTFLRLLRTDRSPDDNHLAQWLFTVCRNRALDVVRKDKRMRTLSETRRDAQVSTDPAPPAVADQRETLRRLGRILASLPPRQQEVIRLKFQEDFSYRQIAAITGLSVSNVGFLIHTAIRTMRDRLGARPAPPLATQDRTGTVQGDSR